MAILITGGKGFIVSQVIPKLLALGEEVVCLEPRATPGRLRQHAGQITMYTGSVANMADVLAVFNHHRINQVASLAFFAFRDNPERLHSEMSIMIQGTANVFEAARLHGAKRVVFPSSIAYYGPQHLHDDGHTPLTETAPSLARSIYGCGKRLCEVLAQDYNQHADLDIVAMRIPVVYGPGARIGARGVNLIATEGAVHGNLTFPQGPDEQVIIGHVEDVADVVVKLLTADQLQYPVYNVGGHTLSYLELAEIGKRITPHLEVTYNHEAFPIELPYLIDHARITKELGIQHRDPETAYMALAAQSRQEAKQ
ncbi:hypothetical protein C2W62_35025 [Candidatus Entotheonella serta]|nr:hypothetical protein C2W62_35025 [Candidatus Entotheonella serta]